MAAQAIIAIYNTNIGITHDVHTERIDYEHRIKLIQDLRQLYKNNLIKIVVIQGDVVWTEFK